MNIILCNTTILRVQYCLYIVGICTMYSSVYSKTNINTNHIYI